MKAEIISIGTELLMGYILNTNAQDIAKELLDIGIGTYYQSVVGDNELRIKEALNNASNRSDIIIITGGLGPTEDDITKQILAEFLGEEVVLDDNHLQRIQSYFQDSGRQMTSINKKQAYTIQGAKVLPNDVGLASGLIYTVKNKDQYYIVLPGPPHEMNHMLKNYAKNFLLDKIFKRELINSVYLNFFDIGESAVADRINDLIVEQTNPTIAIYAQPKRVTVRLTASDSTEIEVDSSLKKLSNKILDRLSEYFIGYGSDQTYEKFTIDQLKKANLTLSVAESLTGGLVLEKLTNTPGASEVIKGGVVTYQTESKEKILNIPKEIIERYSVVSKEVAIQMAERTLDLTQSDIAISLTGVAGPEKLDNHPVGEVFISLAATNSKTETIQLNITNKPREIVRDIAKHEALKCVNKYLNKQNKCSFFSCNN
ncbi:competence/damage-inducible protein A [Aerococcaceae bacterium WGS1372]